MTHEQLILSSYIETSQLISGANPLTGFYMKGNFVINGLRATLEILWKQAR